MDFNNMSRSHVVPYLKSEEVHIWSACLTDNEKNISYFISLLSEDERQKANSYRFSLDKRNFIVSRGVLRCLLGKYLRKAPHDINIIYGFWGKPCLMDKSLHFNLSPSKDYVLYAIAHNFEVGVDIEFMNYDDELENIILTLLSPQEITYWGKLSSKEKKQLFFAFWVSQEAILKAYGKGWLNGRHPLSLDKIALYKKEFTYNGSNNIMDVPYYFEPFPGYASALFVNGPFLSPIHCLWG